MLHTLPRLASHALTSKRSRRWTARLAVFAVLTASYIAMVPGLAGADAGNPILGTIKGEAVDNGDGTVTVFVRGQWNWISHGGDCNFDRAATGVGIAWGDLNGPGTTRGSDETQRVAITGGPTGGTFKLKFSGQTTAAIPYNATATQLESALVALSNVGPGDVTVVGGPGPGSPWNVTFTGGLGKTNVPAMTLGNKSFTGGSNPNVVITTPTPGVSAVYNGYPVTKDAITGYIGTKDATAPAGHTNPADRMVHPVDRGNVPEGYTAAGTDYPASQAFLDPSPPNTAATSTWKGGCGRQPLTAVASQGSHPDKTGRNCATTPASTVCSGHPWGSWGYEKVAGTHVGYSHTYLKKLPDGTSGLPDRICVNFYDVHGGGAETSSSFQVPKSGDITVDSNGDNSIETNAFNVNDGANCIAFHFPQIRVTKTPHTQTISPGGSATWNIHVENTGDVTLTDVHVTDGQAPDCVRTSAAISSDANAPHPGTATFDPGDTYDYSCSKSNVMTGFTNVVVACGTDAVADDVCDDDVATLDDRSGDVIVAGTEQNFAPNDSATLSGLTTPDGKLRFKLYKGSCVAANLILDSGDISVTADGTYSTSNSQTLKQLLTTASLPTATAGTYNWLVTYSGDTQGNPDITFACGTENFIIDNT
jgi:hypothetical protein